MVQGGERARFAIEARESIGILRQRGRQDLDRDFASELRVGRSINLAHPAGADLGGHLVRAEPGTWLERHQALKE
jgi:hypothetical protein